MSTVYILVFNILPLVTQLSSLYFGAKNYQKKQERKLLKKKVRNDSEDTIVTRNSSSSEDENDFSRYSVLK